MALLETAETRAEPALIDSHIKILVLNSGSSSLKFQLIATDIERIAEDRDERLCRGQIERIGGEAFSVVQTRDKKFTVSSQPLGVIGIPGSRRCH